jgi:hypothetical protein
MDSNITFINLAFNDGQIKFDVSIWIIALLVAVLAVPVYRFYNHTKKYKLVKIRLKIPGIGNAEFTPNDEDIQVAHQIWTQLVTRKAAIKINPEEDVITEVYDSWYALFTTTRELISSIPIKYLEEESTKQLISISTDVLNKGLRPHLTTWQVKYRNWYKHQEEKLKTKTTQELQKEYPFYTELIDDMLLVNENLIDYAQQLKIVIGSKVK